MAVPSVKLVSNGETIPVRNGHLMLGLNRGIFCKVHLAANHFPEVSYVLEVDDSKNETVRLDLRAPRFDLPETEDNGWLELVDPQVTLARPFLLEFYASDQRGRFADPIERRCRLGEAPSSVKERKLEGLVVRDMTFAQYLNTMCWEVGCVWHLRQTELTILELKNSSARRVDHVRFSHIPGGIRAWTIDLLEPGSRVRVGDHEGFVRDVTVDFSNESIATFSAAIMDRVKPEPRILKLARYEVDGSVESLEPFIIRVAPDPKQQVLVRARPMNRVAHGGDFHERVPLVKGDTVELYFQDRGLGLVAPRAYPWSPGTVTEAYELDCPDRVDRAKTWSMKVERDVNAEIDGQADVAVKRFINFSRR